MKIRIYTDDNKEGYLQYDESDQSILVTHPESYARKLVHKYLTTERKFVVPGSSNLGDRRVLVSKPTAKLSILEMALSEMYHSIGVHVDWSSEDYEGSAQGVKITTVRENLKADKPIIKSLEGDGYFKIIN